MNLSKPMQAALVGISKGGAYFMTEKNDSFFVIGYKRAIWATVWALEKRGLIQHLRESEYDVRLSLTEKGEAVLKSLEASS